MKHNLTPEIWTAIQRMQPTPAGLSSQDQALLILPFHDVVALPKRGYDTAASKVPCQPSVEIVDIDLSYLDFLRDQIRLKARGDEWSALLGSRLAALQPVLGQKVFIISLRNSAFYVRRKGMVVINYEAFNEHE